VTLSPPTANRGKHYKRPFSALPTNFVNGGATKERSRSRSKCNGPPICGVLLVTGKRRLAEIENENCGTEVGSHHCERRGYEHQPCLSSFHEMRGDG